MKISKPLRRMEPPKPKRSFLYLGAIGVMTMFSAASVWMAHGVLNVVGDKHLPDRERWLVTSHRNTTSGVNHQTTKSRVADEVQQASKADLTIASTTTKAKLESVNWVPPSDCPEKRVAKNVTGPTSRYADQVALVTIAIKQKRFKKGVQELIQSVRKRGAWDGNVILITDAEPDELQPVSSNVKVVKVEPQEIRDKLKQPFMKEKRFKTQLFDMLQRDDTLKDLEYLVFLDADVLLGQPFTKFLDDSLPGLEAADMLMFEEQGRHLAKEQNKDLTVFHSGIILMHKAKSRVCLHEWQRRYDSDRFVNDQLALVNLLYHSPNVNCNIQQLDKDHLFMPNLGPMKNGLSKTFVHFTHGRLKRLRSQLSMYKRCTLMIEEYEQTDRSN